MTVPALTHGDADWETKGPPHQRKEAGSQAMLALSPDSGSETEAEAEAEHSPAHGLSPVSSASSLDTPPPPSETASDSQSPLRANVGTRGGDSERDNAGHPPAPASWQAVAIHCQLVGGGLQGAVDLCAGVSVVDDCGHVLLHTVVKPSLPVTDYRTAATGLSAPEVNAGMPFRKARKMVLGILKGGQGSPAGGREVLLVGVHLQRTLSCLMLEHPSRHMREVPAALLGSRVDQGPPYAGYNQNLDAAQLLMQHFLESQ